MRLISVNLGEERPIEIGKRASTTGIFKAQSFGPVHATVQGLAGDAIVNRKNHGGPDQAIYVYTVEDYAWWSAELGRELAAGTFGENLTIEGLESAALAVGDRLEIGPVILEITAARIPCDTLAARMRDPAFVKRFAAAVRPGAYCRVISEGELLAGMIVALQRYAGPRLTIAEMFSMHYRRDLDEGDIRRHLAAPIAARARANQEDRLARLVAGKEH